MKRKITSLFISLILIVLAVPSFNIPVSALDEGYTRVMDYAELIEDDKEQKIRDMLDKTSDKYNCDVVVLTVKSLEGKTAEGYVDDFFDDNNYGQGLRDSGIIFLVSIEDRDWAVKTNGAARDKFTKAGLRYIVNDVKPKLSSDDFADAFYVFAQLCDKFLHQAQVGDPYDTGNMPSFLMFIDDSMDTPSSSEAESETSSESSSETAAVSSDESASSGASETSSSLSSSTLSSSSQSGLEDDSDLSETEEEVPFYEEYLVISMMIGLVIAGVVVWAMTSGLKNIRPNDSAATYQQEDGFRLTKKKDLYLYETVDRVRIDKDRPNNDRGREERPRSSGRSDSMSGKF